MSIVADLDVIIVSWNAGRQLRRCLDSLARAGRDGFVLSRVVVVDNASSDGSTDRLDYSALPITVIRNNGNEGFAAACNRGASGSGAEYLLFLNPDTELFADSIHKPLAFMERAENGTVGIAGIQLVDESGGVSRSCARFPSLTRCLSRALGLSRISTRWFPSYIMNEWDHGESRAVDHVPGAFYMVRRRIFEELGGFDERFFVYLEDLDFSYRAALAGWTSRYFAEARAFHKGGGLSERVKAERLFYSTSSRILYAFKHFKRVEALMLTLVTCLLEPVVRLCAAALAGSAENARALMRGYAMLFRVLPRITRGMRVNG
jgi:N-acetylglucosaminyl-diphospho-decaprenol L-rhamnosyltransferase